MIRKIFKLFARYPAQDIARPETLELATGGLMSLRGLGARPVAIQLLPDLLYFLVFGGLLARLGTRYPGQANLIVVRSVNGAVGTGILAAIKRTALVAWLVTSPWERAYGRHGGGVAYRSSTWLQPWEDLQHWMRAKDVWAQFRKAGAPYKLTIEGVEVGDLIVDSYLRFKPAPKFDASDRFVRYLIWQAMRDVRQSKRYFQAKRPALYLTSYTTYIENGIPTRVAIQSGAVVWAFGGLSYFGKRLSLEDSFHTPETSSYRTTFEGLHAKEERLEQARIGLEGRLGGGVDPSTSYMRQSAYAQSNVDLPAGLDGAVVVFLHDFYDSPHIFHDLVFPDFWTWINFTIETLTEAKIKFFLKAHPNQISLSDEAISSLKVSYPGLNWLSSSVNSKHLAEAGIACGVTVYGTVAHELAYLGVPSIGAARHPHHGFQFCRTARTRQEYATMLQGYKQSQISIEEMRRQALIFYYMHNLYEETNERELTLLWVSLWKACHAQNSSANDVQLAFERLVGHKKFDELVSKIRDELNTGQFKEGCVREAHPESA